MFAHQGQAEADAGPGPPAAGGGAPGEALEDAFPVLFVDARAGVVDGDAHVVVDQIDADGLYAAAVRLGVAHQVGDDPYQTALVGLHHAVHSIGGDGQGNVGIGGGGDGVHHQLADANVAAIEAGGAGVDAGDLEEVFDHR